VVVKFIAQMKQYMFYGAALAYPAITAFTAVGVAKVAFDIPWFIAFVVLAATVFCAGVAAFRIGLYSADNEITWSRTPSAKTLCDRVERIEKMLGER
jgi:hypothetical protein